VVESDTPKWNRIKNEATSWNRIHDKWNWIQKLLRKLESDPSTMYLVPLLLIITIAAGISMKEQQWWKVTKMKMMQSLESAMEEQSGKRATFSLKSLHNHKMQIVKKSRKSSFLIRFLSSKTNIIISIIHHFPSPYCISSAEKNIALLSAGIKLINMRQIINMTIIRSMYKSCEMCWHA